MIARLLCCLVLSAAGAGSPCRAALFQYSVVAQTESAPTSAFLWIPAEAPQVRGVVLLGRTLAEATIAGDPTVRAACRDAQLAIVYVNDGLAAVDVQKVLDDLADVSGYRELRVAPLFFVGHSAGGPQARELAVKMAPRCFGLMQYRGGVPGGGNDRVPDGVPSLMMVGQFDEFAGRMRDENGRENAWEMARDGLFAFRKTSGGALGSLVVEPGAGHFAWSNRNATYFAMFLRKAAQARIPDFPVDAPEPVTCKPIDPTSGWLTDASVKTFDQATPVAFVDFTGDRGKAQWHFDRELAEANVAYHRGWGRRDQFIEWDHPFFLDAGVRYFLEDVKWVDDGRTFETRPRYADKYPATQPNGPRWADAGKPAGQSAAPIRVRPAGGPVVEAGATRLRLVHDPLNPADNVGRITFIAYSDGNDEFRHTERVGMLPRGFRGLTGGKPQKITFPPIDSPLPRDGAGMKLNATSDAGLPVDYYVIGPAIVENGVLKAHEVPKRAKRPITVRVIAYQPGSGVEPLVRMAKPVERTVTIDE
jgi:hypothetical protein